MPRDEQYIFSKIVELEITGKTMYLTNGEFEELKKRIEGTVHFTASAKLMGVSVRLVLSSKPIEKEE